MEARLAVLLCCFSLSTVRAPQFFFHVFSSTDLRVNRRSVNRLVFSSAFKLNFSIPFIFTFRCIFKAVSKWSTACLWAFRFMQLIPKLYRHLMKPGLRFSACLYASTASSLRPPFASVAPSLFHSRASFGKACSAAWKQSTALSYSPDRLNRTPRPTFGGREYGVHVRVRMLSLTLHF